eukprot:TRINITY_DN2454_c0_g1_i4.p1 TRINITY_DN2454_c0_g1~~TRINITY_DN2454_c0_g1_i4.p1  ORF type:complete len:371 (+),score=31.67 TRINITY_DN2454_c0_g1_i4:379-1491(+)
MLGFALFADPGGFCRTILRVKSKSLPIGIAVVALWLINIGLNIMQAAGTALILDICIGEESTRGMAASSIVQGTTSLLATGLGAINVPHISSTQLVFYVGLVVLFFSTLVTLYVGKEQPLTVLTEVKVSNITILKDMFLGIFKMKKGVILVVIVYFLTSGGMSPWNFYITDYFGEDIYHGDPNAPSNSTSSKLYDKGTRVGSLGFAIMSLVTILFSAVATPLTNKIGIRSTYFIFQFLGIWSCGLTMWPLIQHPIPQLILMGVFGLTNAIANILPFVFVGLLVKEEEFGYYVGIMNVVQVIAQLFANFIASSVMSLCDKNHCIIGGVSPGIATGAVWAVYACIFTAFIRLQKKSESREERITFVNSDSVK